MFLVDEMVKNDVVDVMKALSNVRQWH